MDTKIHTSFIPDKVLNNSQTNRASSGGGGMADILFLLSIVVLATAIVLSAGVFLYDRFLTSSVKTKEVQLSRAKEAFDPVSIKRIMRLDNRINAASEILYNHLAPSEVFNLLQDLTLQSIKYDSLTYKMTTDKGITLNMKGNAQSVNGVALQASVFGDNAAIRNPIFSDLNLTDKGVSFSVDAEIDPTTLQYALVEKKRVEAAASANSGMSSTTTPALSATTSSATTTTTQSDTTQSASTNPNLGGFGTGSNTGVTQ